MRPKTKVPITCGMENNFDNFPTGAKRISFLGRGIFFVGASGNFCIRVKPSNGAVPTGYRSSSSAVWYNGTVTPSGTAPATTTFLYVFGIATSLRDFTHALTSMNQTPAIGLGQSDTSTVWVSTGTMGAQYSAGAAYGCINQGGMIDPGAVLTGVQIFSSDGTAFDAGTITVICEG